MALTPAEKKLAMTIGQAFEGKTLEALRNLSVVKANGIRFFRLYDTHAANNFLPEQPGDFWGGCPRGPALIECKASIAHDSLKGALSTALDFGQAMQLRLWGEAGYVSLVLFHDYKGKNIEAWDGATVGFHRAEGKRLNINQRVAIFPEENLEEWLGKYLTGAI